MKSLVIYSWKFNPPLCQKHLSFHLLIFDTWNDRFEMAIGLLSDLVLSNTKQGDIRLMYFWCQFLVLLPIQF